VRIRETLSRWLLAHWFLGVTASLGVALAASAVPADVAEQSPDAAAASENPEQRTYIGEVMCRACHAVEATHFGSTIHKRVFARPRNELQKRGCESCHGPGSAHMAAPADPNTIIAFTRGAAASVETQTGMCLQCHAGGARIYWVGSTHEVQGLSCSDCHNPMGETSAARLMAQDSINRTCFTCHPHQRAEFNKRGHVPLREGKIACTGCHNPHGSNADPLLKADTVNEVCYACHAEKRGPFLWEHAPVRESCLNCHKPHGSNYDWLLVTAPPFLCQRCHTNPGTVSHASNLQTSRNLATGVSPDARLMNRGCTNCHAQIHGSNHPAGVRFHR
jgi:DmsE family decaheme c-type cytochrome